MIPAGDSSYDPSRLRARLVDEAVAALADGRRRRQGAGRRAEPAAGAAAAAGRADAGGRPRRHRRAAGRPRRRRRARHRRRWPPTPTVLRDPLVARERRCVARPPRRSATGRSATAARSAARSPTPTRPVTCRRPASRWTPDGARRPGGRRARVAAADFFTDIFTTAIGEDEVLVEVRVPKHTGWAAHYEKFHRDRPGLGAGRRRRGGRRSNGAHRRGPGRADQHGRRRRSGRRAVEAALAGQPATAEAMRGRRGRGGEGTTPPSESTGRRVPPAPRRRAHRPGGARGDRRLAELAVELEHSSPSRSASSEAWVGVQRPRAHRAVLPRRHPRRRSTATTSPGTVKVKLGPISLQYTGDGRLVERDEAAHRAVIEANGKDKRGNGTARRDRHRSPDEPAGDATEVDRRHRPEHHRPPGPVRPRRDPGRR